MEWVCRPAKNMVAVIVDRPIWLKGTKSLSSGLIVCLWVCWSAKGWVSHIIITYKNHTCFILSNWSCEIQFPISGYTLYLYMENVFFVWSWQRMFPGLFMTKIKVCTVSSIQYSVSYYHVWPSQIQLSIF